MNGVCACSGQVTIRDALQELLIIKPMKRDKETERERPLVRQAPAFHSSPLPGTELSGDMKSIAFIVAC